MVGLDGSVTAWWGSTGLTRKRPDVSETRCHGITNKNHEPQCEGQTKPMAQGLGKCKGTPHWIGHGDKKASTRPARPFSCWALRCPSENVHQLYPYWPEPELGRNKWLIWCPHLWAAFLKEQTTRSRVGARAFPGCCLVRFVLLWFGFIITPNGSLLSSAWSLYLPMSHQGSGGSKAHGSLKY